MFFPLVSLYFLKSSFSNRVAFFNNNLVGNFDKLITQPIYLDIELSNPYLSFDVSYSLTSDSIDDALSTYARERSKAVPKILKKAVISSKIMALEGPGAKARNMAMNLGGTEMIDKWLAEVWAAA